jgi:hypothetical protein
LEHHPEFLIERFDSGLQEQMRPPFGPLRLLLLTEALADNLVDGRLDKTGADALPIPVALAVVGDEGAIAVNGVVKLIGHAGLAYILAICKQPNGYLRGNLLTLTCPAPTPCVILAA